MPETVFIDRLSSSVLLRLLPLRKGLRIIRTFEPATPRTCGWLRLWRILGLIKADALQIEHHVGQARNESGEGIYEDLLHDARAISSKVRREQLAGNPLIEAMGFQWATDKVLLYFEKLAEDVMKMECLRIGMVEWLVRTEFEVDPSQRILFIENTPWFPYLEDYARSKGIRLLPYAAPLQFGMITKVLDRVWRGLLRTLFGAAGAIRSRLPSGSASSLHQSSGRPNLRSGGSGNPKVAFRYRHGSLSLDPGVRSEFFWLHESGIAFSDVLIYDYASDKAISDEVREGLDAHGIKLLGRGPGIRHWNPTRRIYTVFLRTAISLSARWLTCALQGKGARPYYWSKLLRLSLDYAYWFDFYAANRVVLNVGTLLASIGQSLAADALNAVSASYQYSASDIISAHSYLSAGEDVQFVFSPAFEELWLSLETPSQLHVHIGYLHDRAIHSARGAERAINTRRLLQQNGAQFILCFLDENSMDRWDIPVSNEDAASDYEYLLNWLLEDPALGVVFKPKVSTDLFQRIASRLDLIEKAKDTGRCAFLTSDTVVGDIYPTEAASMADICVGKLYGVTAAMEARLAGIPTVMINTERLHGHPGRHRPRNRIVFDDWDSLREAIERYRASPKEFPEFGDWSPWLSELDPFQDGQASLRMGSFIRWTFEALKSGASKEEALDTAAKEFARAWGKEHINIGGRASSE